MVSSNTSCTFQNPIKSWIPNSLRTKETLVGLPDAPRFSITDAYVCSKLVDSCLVQTSMVPFWKQTRDVQSEIGAKSNGLTLWKWIGRFVNDSSVIWVERKKHEQYCYFCWLDVLQGHPKFGKSALPCHHILVAERCNVEMWFLLVNVIIMWSLVFAQHCKCHRNIRWQKKKL